MNTTKRALQKGLTLVELMTVVTIISLLTSVALISYYGYIARVASSEAALQLDGMMRGLKVYMSTEQYDEKGIPKDRALPDPSENVDDFLEVCFNRDGMKCEPRKNDGVFFDDNPTWRALSFSVDDYHMFIYQWNPSDDAPEGGGIYARAEARLPGDEEHLNYLIIIKQVGDLVEATPMFLKRAAERQKAQQPGCGGCDIGGAGASEDEE